MASFLRFALLPYQASVYALLQAALEVASRGGGDKAVNAVVQKRHGAHFLCLLFIFGTKV